VARSVAPAAPQKRHALLLFLCNSGARAGEAARLATAGSASVAQTESGVRRHRFSGRREGTGSPNIYSNSCPLAHNRMKLLARVARGALHVRATVKLGSASRFGSSALGVRALGTIPVSRYGAQRRAPRVPLQREDGPAGGSRADDDSRLINLIAKRV
jgi:hypothetical protein